MEAPTVLPSVLGPGVLHSPPNRLPHLVLFKQTSTASFEHNTYKTRLDTSFLSMSTPCLCERTSSVWTAVSTKAWVHTSSVCQCEHLSMGTHFLSVNIHQCEPTSSVWTTTTTMAWVCTFSVRTFVHGNTLSECEHSSVWTYLLGVNSSEHHRVGHHGVAAPQSLRFADPDQRCVAEHVVEVVSVVRESGAKLPFVHTERVSVTLRLGHADAAQQMGTPVAKQRVRTL